MFRAARAHGMDIGLRGLLDGESAVLSFLKMRLHEDDPREDQLHEMQNVGAPPLGGLRVETLRGEETPSA